MRATRQPGTRIERRAAAAMERKAMETGQWGEWEKFALPHGIPGTNGWCRQIRECYRNMLYAVLVRPVETPQGQVLHCAIRTISHLEPPWRDKQRIKNELFGAERIAVEVMPKESNKVDEADMYHMWVLPAGMTLPFGLKGEEGP